MKFDFPKKDYDYFISECGFTDDEIEILNYRRRGISIVNISLILREEYHGEKPFSEAYVNRKIKSIKNKIRKIL